MRVEPLPKHDTLQSNVKTAGSTEVDVGYERFLGPEIFFSPEIFSSEFTVPLPNVVDETIQACPIDTRRPLYKNIVLSGGSTMFKDFGRRIQRDVKRLSDGRFALVRVHIVATGARLCSDIAVVRLNSRPAARSSCPGQR